MSPTTGYVKKSAVRGLVIALFAFQLAVTGLVGWVVKEYAASEATKKASLLAGSTAEATRYNTNRSTCALRALVDPQIKENLAQLAGYKEAAKDKSISASARRRNEGRIATTALTIKNLRDFRSVYATVPPDYDCSKLPENPPPLSGYNREEDPNGTQNS